MNRYAFQLLFILSVLTIHSYSQTERIATKPQSSTVTKAKQGSSKPEDNKAPDTDSTSTLEKIIIGLAITILSTLFGLLGSFINNRWLSTAIPARRELKLLNAELDDILRHCRTNLQILATIKLSNGIPSSIHFEKMKVPESSILFSPETYRRIHFRHSGLIYRLKLNIRNRNIELTEVTDYTSKDDVEKDLLDKYMIYLKDKMNYLIEKILKEKNNLSRKDRLKWLKEKTFMKKLNSIYNKINFFNKKTDNTAKSEETDHIIIYRGKFKESPLNPL